jgi:hypothetical protein
MSDHDLRSKGLLQNTGAGIVQSKKNESYMKERNMSKSQAPLANENRIRREHQVGFSNSRNQSITRPKTR